MCTFFLNNSLCRPTYYNLVRSLIIAIFYCYPCSIIITSCKVEISQYVYQSLSHDNAVILGYAFIFFLVQLCKTSHNPAILMFLSQQTTDSSANQMTLTLPEIRRHLPIRYITNSKVF